MPPDAFRCELTPDRLDAGEREVGAALALWTRRRQEALRKKRERVEPWLRRAGLAACAVGAGLSAWADVATSVSTCPAAAARSSATLYQVMTPVFVALGVVFWFLPRWTAALRAWAPRAAARAAPRLIAPLRAQLPTDVSYRLDDGGVQSSRTGRTAFRAVHGAIVGSQTACLFGRPPISRLVRVVWLPGEAERRAVVAALEAAKVPVIQLEEPEQPAIELARAGSGSTPRM